MNILIADDERMIRLSLQSMLEELYPGQHRYFHAANGQALLEAALKEKPDVAFVDIHMPEMDGLTAIGQGRERSPLTDWIILTGYAEFAYAQRAIALGAKEYLIKPVSLTELGETMERVSGGGMERLLSENDRFGLQIMKSVLHYLNQQRAVASVDGYDGLYEVYVFYLDCRDDEAAQARLEDLSHQLDVLGNEILAREPSFRSIAFQLGGGELCFICRPCGKGTVAGRLRTRIDGIPGCTGYHLPAEGLPGVCAAVAEISDLAIIRSVHRWGELVDAEKIQTLQNRRALLSLSLQLEQMLDLFLKKDAVAYKNALNDFYRSPGIQQAFGLVDPQSLGQYTDASIGLEVCTDSLKEFVRSLVLQSEEMFSGGARGEDPDIVEQVKRYVAGHYMEPIGINTISEHYHLTPNYLSRIFKERSGEKFIDYLTEVRIANAKRMFCELPDIKVKDVAERCGYAGTRHFTKTFLRLTSLLPSEYQQKIREEA